ncbi:MAG: hypothetical protein HW416_623 [Chloroflexi bacterium]|nr:hypothetical protein [Chloroflexota bacterium]
MVGLPFLGVPALADLADQTAPPLSILSPSDSAEVGDGNLVMIECNAFDKADGVVDSVQVSIDGSETWMPADHSAEDSRRWRYLWSDPSPGQHRIRVRATGIEGTSSVEQTITVKIADVWNSSYTIDNPYASAGKFRKTELHTHSTNSFDGWTSLPPAQLALEYKKRGYEIVAITDHDVVSNPQQVTDGTFAVIPAYESTSDSGHITGLFVDMPVSPALPAQARIDAINAMGGMAILNHPSWRIGWRNTDLRSLNGFFGLEVFNQIAGDNQPKIQGNMQLWHDVLNAKGRPSRTWAVAVDDAHDVANIDMGWIMLKTPSLDRDAVRQAMTNGAFYASSGPSFGALGVLNGAVTASSPDAAVLRFIDQDLKVLQESPAQWGSYRPTGAERWIRIEAVRPDGRTAWSQPFWLLPNVPTVAALPTWTGTALVGETVPGARVHVSDNGEYLGSAVAAADGQFLFPCSTLSAGKHDFVLFAVASWPDQVEGPRVTLEFSGPSG